MCRLAAGPHHVVFGVPYTIIQHRDEDLLEEWEAHTLEFQSIYAMGRRAYKTIFRCISKTAVFLDKVRPHGIRA
jgi:hypothetical protein